jgi:hypothetical protein
MNDHMTLMAIHGDDCYAIGKADSIKQKVRDIEANGFKLKVEYNTKDYLRYEILFNQNEDGACLGQPHQVKKIANTDEDLVTKHQELQIKE